MTPTAQFEDRTYELIHPDTNEGKDDNFETLNGI